MDERGHAFSIPGYGPRKRVGNIRKSYPVRALSLKRSVYSERSSVRPSMG